MRLSTYLCKNCSGLVQDLIYTVLLSLVFVLLWKEGVGIWGTGILLGHFLITLVTEPEANAQTILGSLKLKIKAEIQICLEWYLLQSNNRSLVYFVLSCQTNWKISNSDHLDSWFSRHVLFNGKHSLISQ